LLYPLHTYARFTKHDRRRFEFFDGHARLAGSEHNSTHASLYQRSRTRCARVMRDIDRASLGGYTLTRRECDKVILRV
jgi:hypothetical protein